MASTQGQMALITNGAGLAALWLYSLQSVGFILSLTMVSSNVAGYTKKQLTGVFVFVGYCVGNVIGLQTFIEKEAPFIHLCIYRVSNRNETTLNRLVRFYGLLLSLPSSVLTEYSNQDDHGRRSILLHVNYQ